jgi:hypothetical protein
LLGDEVEALLGILEEVQSAFDIYAPVLHHYPKVRFVSTFTISVLPKERLFLCSLSLLGVKYHSYESFFCTDLIQQKPSLVPN